MKLERKSYKMRHKGKRTWSSRLTRISWPIQEYEDFLFRAHTTAKAKQHTKTMSDSMETSPRSGNFRVFFPQFLHLLFMERDTYDIVHEK